MRAVVVAPTGFVSDHLEVLWDLDNEARETAAELGMAFARAATAGTHPAFVGAVADLIQERVSGAEPKFAGRARAVRHRLPRRLLPRAASWRPARPAVVEPAASTG